MAKGGTYHASHRFFEAIVHHAKKKKKILTTLTSILSFELRKSDVKERGKREISWCHNYLIIFNVFASNSFKDSSHHGHFNVKSPIAHYAARPNHASCG